ncbi:MAG: peptidase M22 [bacterium]|nr:peptidase M22 [bacterium]
MSFYLGLDTSNYTTSAALYDNKSGRVISERQLLDVPDGSLGLRQSEALFLHTKRLPEIIKRLFNDFDDKICGVGVSTRPRSQQDSYMPCFLVGELLAKSVAEILKVDYKGFSHQDGHISAAIFSSGMMELFDQRFIAFHLSGGTTEAVLVQPDDNGFKCDVIAKSLDLKLGQAIDRVGKLLGLPFPSGRYIDELSQTVQLSNNIKVKIKGADCCVSGVENQCKMLLDSGESKETVARYVIEFASKTIEKMTENLVSQYGDIPIVFAGGVSANSIIRKNLSERFNTYFASPELSSDNAVGVAVLASRCL